MIEFQLFQTHILSISSYIVFVLFFSLCFFVLNFEPSYQIIYLQLFLILICIYRSWIYEYYILHVLYCTINIFKA